MAVSLSGWSRSTKLLYAGLG